MANIFILKNLHFLKLLFIFKQVVYINGRPFVLRDVERPFSNLEYTVCFANVTLL